MGDYSMANLLQQVPLHFLVFASSISEGTLQWQRRQLQQTK